MQTGLNDLKTDELCESIILVSIQGSMVQSPELLIPQFQSFKKIIQPGGDEDQIDDDDSIQNNNITKSFQRQMLLTSGKQVQMKNSDQQNNLQQSSANKNISRFLSNQIRMSLLASIAFRKDGTKDNIELMEEIEFEFGGELTKSFIQQPKMQQIQELGDDQSPKRDQQITNVDLQELKNYSPYHFHCKFNPIFPQIQNTFLLNKSGTMIKFSGGLFMNQKNRECNINKNIFKYFDQKRKEKAKCILDFQNFAFTCKIIIHQKQTIIMQIIKPKLKRLQAVSFDKVLKFKFQKEDETLAWYSILNNATRANKKTHKPFPRFWKDFYITEQYLREVACTGDIILFKGKSMNCKLQRVFTGSDYDHVGIVFKSSSNKIYILEATGGEGVGLFAWESLMNNKWYDLYDKLTLRQLIYQRDLIFSTKMEKFLMDNLGKQYKLTVSKLLRNESVVMDQSQMDNSSRTYFCSELVAACFKKIGILPKQKSTTQYWPGSFSNLKEELQLLNNAKLSDEQIVIFDQQI